MPVVNWVLSNPLHHKYRYAQQHSVTKWKWYIGLNRFRQRIRLIYWGEKREDRNGCLLLSPSYPLSTIINFYSWNGLALCWVWPTGSASQISEDRRGLRFDCSSGSFLASLLVDNDYFSSGGHTSCWEPLSCSYYRYSSISSFHTPFPLTSRPKTVKDLTLSSKMVPLYVCYSP